MQRKPIALDMQNIPAEFHRFLEGATVYDSSCSREARVYFLDKASGFYLKTAPKGSLQKEAALTDYFHQKGLAAEVLAYESGNADWLLTCRVPGEDCIWQPYLDDPKRLCEITGSLLRMLHEQETTGCPVPNRTADYLETAHRKYKEKTYDFHLFPDNWGYASPEEAWRVVEETGRYLKSDTLLHGDYCLPNILLDNWQFSGFIDLDSGGVGDRHVDLFWGAWTLQYNLKTDRYRDRFLDAYGREKITLEVFDTIAAIEVFI